VAEEYTSHAVGRSGPRPPSPIRAEHARRLTEEARQAERQGIARRATTAQELELKSLDPLRQGPELVAVTARGTQENRVQFATVYVPAGEMSYFFQRLDQYANEDTATGNPRNANMVERIAVLRLATLREIWTDARESFPRPHDKVWWEVWLRRSDGHEIERLQASAANTDMVIGSRHLVFDNRVIVLAQATATQLASALNVIDDFAELRAARVSSEFFTALSPAEQADWISDLVNRTEPAPATAPAACILDTGINRGHPLLGHSLSEDDLHTCNLAWGASDHDGHGTQMAGVTLYGDLRAALEDGNRVRLRHCLESVKILAPTNDTDPDLYGALTAEAVARTEVQAPTRRRAFSMAITARPDRIAGTPTSWSAAVDALAAGREFDTVRGELKYIDEASAESHRLFIVSAGNVRDLSDTTTTYLDRCDTHPIEDPSQAWNALTVGAYTELVDVGADGTSHEGWTPLAQPGDLSPFSRTGVGFQRQWPTKPDIVLEGGNAAVSPDGSDVDFPDSLQLLTTAWIPTVRLLTTIGATSGATAQAGYMAATIAAEYPAFWPETVRGLLVHSAEWTKQMKLQMSAAGTSRRQRAAFIRRYGFGVPTLERALRSATNALTLIVQDTIHPFFRGALREMHLHDLPWPRDVLADLGETPVRMRVTLSYFIEPSPTRRGWRRRYRYASHQLRFDLREPDETNDDFRKRINRRALAEEEERPVRVTEADDWYVGSETRNRGSLHTDIWEGTAADLAARGLVAVYPVTGWWKELQARDQSEFGARYSLLVSIETPVEDVDIWTPVAIEAEVPITIEI
jgi:Subtilase family